MFLHLYRRLEVGAIILSVFTAMNPNWQTPALQHQVGARELRPFP